MVRIRLKRVGTKHKAAYKIVVADQRTAQSGKYLEEVGTYSPHGDPAKINLIEERISDWISKGAQPSESVTKLFHIAGFDNNGTLKKLNLTKSKKKKKELESSAPAAEEVQDAPEEKATEEPAAEEVQDAPEEKAKEENK
ncbi:MAG: 30S ribosomal protein S16 [Actinobacteria bacterium]|nr:30S ribosomal protein S16 [Actinomycetota bacterium]